MAMRECFLHEAGEGFSIIPGAYVTNEPLGVLFHDAGGLADRGGYVLRLTDDFGSNYEYLPDDADELKTILADNEITLDGVSLALARQLLDAS